MNDSRIRVRTAVENGIAEIKALIEHPMETGLRKDPATGETVPAHYIEDLVCEHAGRIVLSARCSRMVARNPYFAFRFRGVRSGDVMRIRWTDNLGGTGAHDFTL